MPPIALLSVTDKTGIGDLGKRLVEAGFTLYGSAGTTRALVAAGVACLPLDDYLQSPEILSGRVKTLHPKTHGGILSRRTPEDRADLAKIGAQEIDVVVVNLYDFAAAVAAGVDDTALQEKIDIGGPALIRAAAKACPHVLLLTDPADYDRAFQDRTPDQELSFRQELAAKAFAATRDYDAMIAKELALRWTKDTAVAAGGQVPANAGSPLFPAEWSLPLQKVRDLRYGENAHQPAALYRWQPPIKGIAEAEVLHGKPLSYNNLLDLDAAAAIAGDFERPTAAAVKHMNPCGVASRDTLVEALQGALEADPTSVFGGILAFNRDIDLETAQVIRPMFIECVIAPGFADDALALLKEKKRMRILCSDYQRPETEIELRSISGGVLAQTFDKTQDFEPKVATKRAPTEDEMLQLRFAWKLMRHVKSNTIVLAKDQMTVGIGAGQMSRVDAAKIAVMKSNGLSVGSVMASDAFFPFRDGIDAAHEGGVTAVIQPGGSIRDQEVIDACEEHGMAMVFTGYRQFRH